MKSTHLKLLLTILIISFCAMPCYAVGIRAFRVDFPYFDALYDDFLQYDGSNVYEANDTNRTQEISENIKTDNSTENNQVITATQPTGVVLNIDKAYFSFPLDFSFYIAETRKATISAGPYYSFEFLKFQEEYNDVELYRENNLGLDVGVKFSQNVSSFLDINLALGALYSFSNSDFLLARAGISFDWRL